MVTYLDGILEAHRRTAADDDRSLDALVDEAKASPSGFSFKEALQREGLSVIAEVKRRSPSKGELAIGLDVEVTTSQYQAGGAAALSILTDQEFFGGSRADLERARQTVSLPILRKDFTVAPHDICDARIMGADAVLLIVAALSDEELERLSGLARELVIDVLFEVHDEGELERALNVDAAIVGINQRDLKTFDVDPERALAVLQAIPPEVITVAESGIASSDDASTLATAGFDAVLVGEYFVRAADATAAVASMSGLRVGRRLRTVKP